MVYSLTLDMVNLCAWQRGPVGYYVTEQWYSFMMRPENCISMGTQYL